MEIATHHTIAQRRVPPLDIIVVERVLWVLETIGVAFLLSLLRQIKGRGNSRNMEGGERERDNKKKVKEMSYGSTASLYAMWHQNHPILLRASFSITNSKL